MEWDDKGIIIKSYSHGEGKAIATIFTENHGRHLGYIRGTKKLSALLQPGNVVDCRWKARLQDQLGSWIIEPSSVLQPRILQKPSLLMSMLSMCAWVDLTLAEREQHIHLYQATSDLLNKLAFKGALADYVYYEIELLKSLGFGLDLSKCAATGSITNLTYVSPRTGRAVSAAAGEIYSDKLLVLPQFLVESCENISRKEILSGLHLTGYFLERFILSQLGKRMPFIRQRLIGHLRKHENSER